MNELFPRVRFRPKIPILGLLFGLMLGVGGLLLGQQFGIVYPTRGTAITMVAGGPLLSLVLSNVGKAIAFRRMNAQITKAENSLPVGEGDAPAAGGWTATHRVPAGGVQAWAEPDPSTSATSLDEGVELQVVEKKGDWARVAASNGWEGWVDARNLEKA